MEMPTYASTAVFVLFFGMALIVAIQKRNWLAVVLFVALGALSVWADIRQQRS